ncbi:hypothetical protein B0I37DRAFT_314025 [Chaetomium sp. MPI-CAGE-AT-0009]|nr:hypothetical protein B0I37DRAFT_314025 [Chaetomium sp. MPI-CAGE-AT-0009]
MTTTLGSHKEPPPPLLCLPPVIRHRIYRFLGLASWNGSPYTFDLSGPGREIRQFWDWEEQCPHDFHGLLLSCHDIHAEAAALLYSGNRFVLYYTVPGSLQPLLALTATALSSLAALKIVLTQASCHQQIRNRDGRDCCLYQYRSRSNAIPTCNRQYHVRQHQYPLLSPLAAFEGDNDPSTGAQTLVREWHAAAGHLSPYVTPGRLELSLVCDIDPRHEQAIELARSALEPLLLLPLLRACHIRLCHMPDSRLRQLAQDAALQSYGMSTPYLEPSSTKSSTSEILNLNVDYPYKRFAATQFLREVIPPHCVAHLRFLELVFPPYLPSTWPQTDHPATRDWCETVGWLRDKINGPGLTLRLVMTKHDYDARPQDNRTITTAEGDMIHRAYMDILQALKRLAEGTNGLAKFYADLRYPWEQTAESEDQWTGRYEGSWLQERERELKESAERYVMGDRYDNLYANDKKEPQKSLWQHVFDKHDP